MDWPKNILDVHLSGYDIDLNTMEDPSAKLQILHVLRSAIDNNRVKRAKTCLFFDGGSSSTQFDFLGFRYELMEQYEIVTDIRRVCKTDDEIEKMIEEIMGEESPPLRYNSWADF